MSRSVNEVLSPGLRFEPVTIGDERSTKCATESPNGQPSITHSIEKVTDSDEAMNENISIIEAQFDSSLLELHQSYVDKDPSIDYKDSLVSLKYL